MNVAAKLKGKREGAVAGGPSTEYGADFYSWTVEQAAALRAGRLSELDLANLAEEIESLGKVEFSKLESALRLMVMHMCKWDQQPERRSRSWILTIMREREVYADLLKDNPGLKPRREEALERAYRKARLGAADETGLPLARFPKPCPYDLTAVLTRTFDWPET